MKKSRHGTPPPKPPPERTQPKKLPDPGKDLNAGIHWATKKHLRTERQRLP